jgi:carboxymethylenebutenolidase
MPKLNMTRPLGSEPEDFHLSRRVAVASMFFSGYALSALSADAEPIHTDEAGLTIEEVTIPNGAPKPLPAYIARPSGGGKHPVIMVTNEVFGIHDYIKDICRRLAKLGYVAIAPDYFYRSGVNLPAITDFAQIRPVIAQATPPQVDGDVKAATDWAKKQPYANAAKIGITGFCWGGAVVWRNCMTDDGFKAGVAWYGDMTGLVERAADLKCPVLGLYGAKDPFTKNADPMKAALASANKKGSELVVYDDAAHGFHADYRASYVEADAKDGWTKMLAHFKANGVA